MDLVYWTCLGNGLTRNLEIPQPIITKTNTGKDIQAKVSEERTSEKDNMRAIVPKIRTTQSSLETVIS